MCTVHVLMIFCHLINRSFVCKAKEGHYIRMVLISCKNNGNEINIAYIVKKIGRYLKFLKIQSMGWQDKH